MAQGKDTKHAASILRGIGSGWRAERDRRQAARDAAPKKPHVLDVLKRTGR